VNDAITTETSAIDHQPTGADYAFVLRAAREAGFVRGLALAARLARASKGAREAASAIHNVLTLPYTLDLADMDPIEIAAALDRLHTYPS
jgi:hypothetical protein